MAVQHSQPWRGSLIVLTLIRFINPLRVFSVSAEFKCERHLHPQTHRVAADDSLQHVETQNIELSLSCWGACSLTSESTQLRAVVAGWLIWSHCSLLLIVSSLTLQVSLSSAGIAPKSCNSSWLSVGELPLHQAFVPSLKVCVGVQLRVILQQWETLLLLWIKNFLIWFHWLCKYIAGNTNVRGNNGIVSVKGESRWKEPVKARMLQPERAVGLWKPLVWPSATVLVLSAHVS